jgi:hypothetical protein
MTFRTYLTPIVALCATLSSTGLILFAGIAAACSGTGGGGGGCAAPSVSTGSATVNGSNSVTLNGSVNPQGCYTEYAFEYGRSSEGYPDEIYGSAGSGTSPVSVSTSSAIVQPSTSYHYRLTAWNAGDEVTGGSGSFTTPAACPAPTVTTDAATSITDTTAVLNGSVNPNGCQTTYMFEWGPSSSPSTYPNYTPITAANSSSPIIIKEKLSGLKPGTGYHFRLTGTNTAGKRSNGVDKPFTTLSGPQYLALGDSYSSGTGTGTEYIPGSPLSCHRTIRSYPYLMAQAHPSWTLINATCHGATTANMLNEQIPSTVSPNIKWATYTIGGNDAGFGNVMLECTLALDPITCEARIIQAQSYITNTLPGRLDLVNNAIKAKVPNAKIIVLDYPRLFNSQLSCQTADLSTNQKIRLNETSDMLRTVVHAATTRAGSAFVFRDVIPSFVTHAICDGGGNSSIEWLTGVSAPGSEKYHPKSAGHSNVYYPLVLGVTG